MKRRTFVQAVLATLAAPHLSATEMAAHVPEVSVWNTATLTAAMEKRFACYVGPAMAFFEVSKKTGDIIAVQPDNQYRPLGEAQPLAGDNLRYIYQTYACAVEGGNAKEAEARLAKHFYDAFCKLPKGALVWRVKPQFASEDVTHWGDTYATKEAVEDGRVDLAALPAGVEQDEWGNCRHVLKKTKLHKMRMRLVMPHLYVSDEEAHALPALFKPEGAQITRII